MKVAVQPLVADNERSWSLTAALHDVEVWRRRVDEAARALGADRDAREVAEYGITELLSNVHKHVGEATDCRLVVEREGDALCVRLSDTSHEVPQVLSADPLSENGRGLWLLRAMADDLGYTLIPEGKWVWVHTALRTAALSGCGQESSSTTRSRKW
ncbi:ATP-binding protein [Streptomyces cacaoi]|uniref:Histidine kinase/HSP90-like ATPase domain-containing protein n=1 Tax=Streptomyces cacaoi TaxID=1898 RepID=A0A4Y3RAE1_STRCI|nr:ATP-binding protein [Streptomyces cacaoi]GEB54379.1 hypothetical protein SCA03_69300 [Streptomyces cacaoi]